MFEYYFNFFSLFPGELMDHFNFVTSKCRSENRCCIQCQQKMSQHGPIASAPTIILTTISSVDDTVVTEPGDDDVLSVEHQEINN